MTNPSYEREILLNAILKVFPPLISESLLNDPELKKTFGIQTEAMLTLGAAALSVQRSELYNAVRAVLAGKDKAEIIDTKDRHWNVTNGANEAELPTIVLASDQLRLNLPNFSVLSEDRHTRIRSIEAAASDVNLPLDTQNEWRRVLEERALEDDEVDAFYSDIFDTPVHVARTIKGSISTGKTGGSLLVPNSRRYFERLVGPYDGSGSIQDYATGIGRKVFEQLIAWNPCQGFLYSLLLSSHPSLVAEINAEHLSQKDLEQAFDYIAKEGDIISKLGAIEFGLRIQSDRPEVTPFLLSLVQKIRDDDVGVKDSEFNLLTALFVFVDGELARTRLLTDTPPFYRRLASFAQAALIHRQIIPNEIDRDRFCKWALANRAESFYMQSLADMRLEPRWNPELIDARQLQADFLGRILIASANAEAALSDEELRDSLLGKGDEGPKRLIQGHEPLRLFFPGALEGNEDRPDQLPNEIADYIEEKLGSEQIDATSFIALVNSALLYKIPADYAELAAKALRLANHTLANLEDKSQLMSILNGLAKVAAVSRNPKLADELRILIRRYRLDPQHGVSVEEAMFASLVASAAHKELMEWRVFVGECLTELAFGELKGSEGEDLLSHVWALLHSVPELWVSCARADAALKACCS